MQYNDLLARAEQAERSVERLTGNSDAADLAIGRAAAVQRQLDEALSRLARFEQSRSTASSKDASAGARLDAMEADLTAAQARTRELGSRVENLSRELSDAKAALSRAEAGGNAAVTEAVSNARRELEVAQQQLAQRESELQQLQQAAAAATSATDRANDQANNQHAATAAANLARYEATVVELTTLRGQLGELRNELSAAKQQAASATDADTATNAALPATTVEQLSIIEESIDSLRANLRAASDETAMMPSNESVTIIADAISQAAEHVERARDALRTILA